MTWIPLAMALSWGTAEANDARHLAPEPVAALQDAPAPLSDAEKKRQERLAALEAAQSTQAARVVVLKWQGQDTDYRNEVLIRNVKTRIARPDAVFYPEVDLYQAGRKEVDRSVRPIDQRAIVPAKNIALLQAATDEIAPVPWNAMTESDWGLKANELRDLSNEVWFIDRPELREPLFMLYVQIGRAAENTNNPAPPFFEQVGKYTVNWYWYLAGAMGHVEPELMAKLTDQDLYASVDYYKQLLDKNDIEQMTLAFEQDDIWDAKEFASEYEVFINGLPVLIEDKDSLYKVPPGFVNVYLKRSDGHSLSDRVDITKLEEKIYFVREVARKKMGIDFIDQLMKHPNECTPELDGDILNYLSIYAKLHPEAEIYIAVPEGGSPNRILLWRWDRPSGTLQKVLDNTGGFPMRFALVGSAGMWFNNIAVEVEPGEFDPEAPTEPPIPTAAPTLTPSGIPLSLQLRGHLGRLMLATGFDATFGMDGTPWQDLYQIDSDGIAVEQNSTVVKERQVSRNIYGAIGVVFLKDAAIGFGPRGYLKFGWMNVPHVYEATIHPGITMKGPLGGDGRVRTLIDIDFMAGAVIPFGDTVLREENGDPIVGPTFGATVGVGLTF